MAPPTSLGQNTTSEFHLTYILFRICDRISYYFLGLLIRACLLFPVLFYRDRSVRRTFASKLSGGVSTECGDCSLQKRLKLSSVAVHSSPQTGARPSFSAQHHSKRKKRFGVVALKLVSWLKNLRHILKWMLWSMNYFIIKSMKY